MLFGTKTIDYILGWQAAKFCNILYMERLFSSIAICSYFAKYFALKIINNSYSANLNWWKSV